ncbi:MAG: EAL domain-containing protein [Gammaproteobacteria bacterium]|nr:EAL domain-containing protein [Gammaproteobacteria bacterium]
MNINNKELIILILALLSGIAVSTITWNAIDVVKEYQNAQRLVTGSRIAELTLRVGTELAYERGITATLLAIKETNVSEAKMRLQRQRQKVDALYMDIEAQMSQFTNSDNNTELSAHMHRLDQERSQLILRRAEIDIALQQNGSHPEIRQRWISEVTSHIAKVNDMRRALLAPQRAEDFANHYGQLIQESFQSHLEISGLQRALLGQVIAEQRPLTQNELMQLYHQNHLFEVIEEKLNGALKFFPPSVEISEARQKFVAHFHVEYRKLRDSIVAAGELGSDYPIDSLTWFQAATDAIESSISYSKALNIQINHHIASVVDQANITVALLIATIILVAIIFAFSYWLIVVRFIRPMALLEQAANTIAHGDLEMSIQLDSKDEFGHFADTLDAMRLRLLEDRQHREQTEQELRKLHNAMIYSVSSIVITDVEGIVEYVNPCFETTTGFRSDEIVGTKLNQLRSEHTTDKTYKEMWDRIKSGAVWEGELQNRKKNGDLFWELVSIAPVLNSEGVVTHFIGTHHDITERKSMEGRLNYLAYHDDLTGLPNRILLSDRFHQDKARAKRNNEELALLILDLDNFKAINDTLGHNTGDQVLIEIATRLKGQARSGETVTRYGGDEFVIILTDISSKLELTVAAKRIIDIISEPIEQDGRTLHVTCSVGVSIWPDNGDDLPSLLSHADAAMYLAKDQGRDQFQFYTDELNQKNQQRMEMESELRGAIERDELELHYQPQYDIKLGIITGMEALLRWHHPTLGTIPPTQFIPIAEETGFILAIGQWVLERAVEQTIKWQDMGYENLIISVNVSVRQLEEPDFSLLLRHILKKLPLAPEKLELEVTETMVMHDPKTMIAILNEVKEVGVELALDDFGTGHSSLAYLQRFPFDKLKIDRSFIKNVDNSEDSAAIAKTIGAMARSLHLDLIAEGVETQEQVDFLIDCGCDAIQGFYFSRPVPAAEFEKLLANSAINSKN